MSERSKRTIRAVFQVFSGLLIAVPIALAASPVAAPVAFGAWVVFLTNLMANPTINGLLPGWLKADLDKNVVINETYIDDPAPVDVDAVVDQYVRERFHLSRAEAEEYLRDHGIPV